MIQFATQLAQEGRVHPLHHQPSTPSPAEPGADAGASAEPEAAGPTGETHDEQLLAGQNHVLRLLAEGQSLQVVLGALCHTLEAALPGAACSVLLLDETGERLRHAAAPSLPASYLAAIDGLRIGPAAGSCGTAAYRGRPVVVADIASDPLWEGWRDLARQHRLAACWSVPIFDRQAGHILGTFAVYYREPRAPTADEIALVERSGDLAGVAIRHARSQAALVEAKEDAEAANQAKGAFLAMTSHELRTPLQAVLGYTEFLLGDPRRSLTAEQRDDLRAIAQGGQRMLHIIDQMLDFSRIDAGRLDLERRPVALSTILEQVRQDVAPQASQKGLRLEIALPDAPPLVLADAERLRQVLLNLVGNAVKFTEEGSVAITVEQTGDQVVIAVRDTGIGIAPEALPHIFEPFRQAENRLVRRHGGAGLGLAIARRLAGLMSGSIAVESAPERGSTFTLRMPAAPATS